MTSDFTMDDFLTEIDKTTELNDMHKFLHDEDVDRALGTIIKLIAKPNVPPAVAIQIITELQALSAKFGLMASTAIHLNKPKAGSEEYIRKGLYKSLSEHLDRLAAAMKYTVKS